MGLYIGIHPMFDNGGVVGGILEPESWIMTEDSIYIACENEELLKLETDE